MSAPTEQTNAVSATDNPQQAATAPEKNDDIILAAGEVVFPPRSGEHLNTRSTGVKRLMNEAKEFQRENEFFTAKPMEDNLFEWHFTFRGPPDTVYAGGVYHGRILLPANYPMKPPNLMMLTPNGRFETNKNICLSISGYHPETWLPSWSIRTALLALIGFMPTHSAGALGGLECSAEERQRLAIKSLDWHCQRCDLTMRNALSNVINGDGSSSSAGRQQIIEEIRKNASTPKTQASAVPVQNDAPNAEETELTGRVVDEIAANASFTPTNLQGSVPTSTASPLVASMNQTRQNSAAAQRTTPSSSLGFSPLFWMFILSTLFLALLLRRIF